MTKAVLSITTHIAGAICVADLIHSHAYGYLTFAVLAGIVLAVAEALKKVRHDGY